MADSKNVITLGIGSAPGNIRYFVLMGLDVNPSTVGPVPSIRTYAVDSETRVMTVNSESRVLAVPSESRVVAVS